MTTAPYFWLFLMALPVVAFLYAGVGHGGASGYLALMSLFSMPPEAMRPTALLLNLFVAGVSFFFYYKADHFKPRLFLYFALTSIPLAFLGGSISVEDAIYKKILGALLLIAILRMIQPLRDSETQKHNVKIWQALLAGAVIGFLSGLIGIGGGILLTPIILLWRWGNMKEAAAVSALFIWVNSAAGLVGQLIQGAWFSTALALMVCLAVAGGWLGSYTASKKMSNKAVRYMLVAVLATASFKLIFMA